jgi:hypothetical protein
MASASKKFGNLTVLNEPGLMVCARQAIFFVPSCLAWFG